MNSHPPTFSRSPLGFLFGISSALCIFTTGIPEAQAQLLTKASEDFQWEYSPTVLPNQISPSTESWVLRAGGSGNSASVDGSVLSITSPAGSHHYYEARAANWRDSFVSSVGFTVELKVWVKTDNTFGVNLGFNEGTLLGAGRAPILKIDGGGTSWQVGTGSVRFEELDGNRNDDGFHIFRLVKLPSDGDVAGAYNIYRDGVLIGENIVGSNAESAGLDRFFFGAIGSALGQNVQADVEWVRWDASGAYAPIPEPVSLTFLGAGSLMLFARKLSAKNRN